MTPHALARRSVTAVCAALFLGAAPDAPVPAVPQVVAGPVGRRLDDLLTRAEGFGWSGQALVEHEGELVLHKAYGFADRGRGRAMADTTPIGIASMSKIVTAVTVLRLRDAGRLRLDARLGDLLPGVPPDKAGITVHRLLTHTAGIRPGDIVDDFEAPSREELIARILAQPLAEGAENEWRYANSGYSLLAAVVEAVGGAPFEQVVHSQVLDVAGMSNTHFMDERGRDDDARAYIGAADQGSPQGWRTNWRLYGAGGLMSTAADLYRLELALREGRLLTADSRRRLTMQHVSLGDDGFGYAFFLGGEGTDRYQEHGGDWQRGYNGVFVRYPGRKSLMILTNNARDQAGQWMRHDVQSFVDAMVRGDTVPESRLPPRSSAVPVAQRVALVGAYRLMDGSRLLVSDDGAQLWITAEGPRASRLLQAADSTESAAFSRAETKATRLLGTLVGGSVAEGFGVALEEEGRRFLSDYQQEWSELVAARGPVRGFTIYGSAMVGGAVRTIARLQHDTTTTDYQLLWRAGGAGRLGGSLVRPAFMPDGYLVALVLRKAEDAGLIAYDLFHERSVRLTAVPTDHGTISTLRFLGTDEAAEREPRTTP